MKTQKPTLKAMLSGSIPSILNLRDYTIQETQVKLYKLTNGGTVAKEGKTLDTGGSIKFACVDQIQEAQQATSAGHKTSKLMSSTLMSTKAMMVSLVSDWVCLDLDILSLTI